MATIEANRAARRPGRSVAAAALFLIGLIGAALVTPGTAVAATAPTMTFKGIVNVLGALDSINVTPAEVSVAAGGQVVFANAAGVPLTLNIGGQAMQLADGASRAFTFGGLASAQRVTVTGTAFDLPVVGSLTSSTGTVYVAAATPSEPQNPAPSTGSSPAPAPGGNLPGGDPANSGITGGGAPSRPAGAPPGSGQALPKPRPFGKDPLARAGMASAGALPPITEQTPSSAGRPDGAAPPQHDAASGLDGGRAADAEGSGRGSGLLALIAIVVLGGIAAAVIRTVLAQRSVPMRR